MIWTNLSSPASDIHKTLDSSFRNVVDRAKLVTSKLKPWADDENKPPEKPILESLERLILASDPDIVKSVVREFRACPGITTAHSMALTSSSPQALSNQSLDMVS